ncbi:AidA/PixA family protein [Tenacibaculum sp. IB213877]|uniref:AidA/PixA family protein n=1 Tax=Tenacibaculum sp. IB213877 TaxID=3097351 RepID=UPI002A5AF41F|nr:AidA/PixA family protein [Tenacibaculum sp. IB213877]MDY0780297.1 AidA/PixA family protein [Tenacibaculum sp. IB213877]
MPNTINILSVIDVETILSNNLKGGDSPQSATSLGSNGVSDTYVYMITAQGFVDSNDLKNRGRASSELTIDARVGDTIQWELTCPGSGLQFNAIIAGVHPGYQSNPGSLSAPQAILTTRHIYTQAGQYGYQVVQQMDYVSHVQSAGTTQYDVVFQVMNQDGTSLGYFKWDPFVKVLENEQEYKAAKAESLKKPQLA